MNGFPAILLSCRGLRFLLIIVSLCFFVASVNKNIKVDDPSTWTNTEWPGVMANGGMIKQNGCGQAPFMWQSRTLPKIRKIYECHYRTRSLLVSLDSASAIRGGEFQFQADNYWMHVGCMCCA